MATKMKPLVILLPDDLRGRLQKCSKQMGAAMGELVRRALVASLNHPENFLPEDWGEIRLKPKARRSRPRGHRLSDKGRAW